VNVAFGLKNLEGCQEPDQIYKEIFGTGRIEKVAASGRACPAAILGQHKKPARGWIEESRKR